ncbi:unnamed protein product [Durusdinium trenchii]|uniref:Uncharacterized protein n=1 Tax=Durusdinium trenchii TaxID=1381693 RepID=A0ABP0QXY1_9DINO
MEPTSRKVKMLDKPSTQALLRVFLHILDRSGSSCRCKGPTPPKVLKPWGYSNAVPPDPCGVVQPGHPNRVRGSRYMEDSGAALRSGRLLQAPRSRRARGRHPRRAKTADRSDSTGEWRTQAVHHLSLRGPEAGGVRAVRPLCVQGLLAGLAAGEARVPDLQGKGARTEPD